MFSLHILFLQFFLPLLAFLSLICLSGYKQMSAPIKFVLLWRSFRCRLLNFTTFHISFIFQFKIILLQRVAALEMITFITRKISFLFRKIAIMKNHYSYRHHSGSLLLLFFCFFLFPIEKWVASLTLILFPDVSSILVFLEIFFYFFFLFYFLYFDFYCFINFFIQLCYL